MRFAALLLCVFLPLSAEEGKWTPQQVLELDANWLKSIGLQLPPSRLWDAKNGTGLLAATVSTGGCSAGFVSADGLILTNHHCLFGLLQEHSRPDRDLITNGFVARTRDEELPGKTAKVTVPRKFTDVTMDIERAAGAASDDLARQKLIEDRQKALVAECEKTPGARCQVASFDGGLQFVLIESMELSDIRLVYAPPRAVGEYGGETDNWIWPRHTGDFSMARAYKDGKPYKPEFWFPIAKQGVKPGDFVMVLGYPGRTFRSYTAREMADQRDNFFGLRKTIYGEWIRIIEDSTKGDAAAEIAMADRLKSHHNRYKNAGGQIEGLRRGRIIEKQEAQDEAVLAWAKARPDFASAVAAKKELDGFVDARGANAARGFLFGPAFTDAPVPLRHAITLVRLAHERKKPDAERDPDYMQRNLPRLRDRLEREQKSLHVPTDEKLVASFLRHAGLPGDAAAMVRGSRVTVLEDRLRMYEETPEQLAARKDPLLDFALRLHPDLEAERKLEKQRDGAISRLRPAWRRAVIAHAGKPVSPDANSTLRVSFAHVKGYQPRDAVVYAPQTFVRGILEKDTGEDPFNAPKPLLAAAEKELGVPVCFLADADTTGGNSGSPTINGRGELVGLNFDRVWENVANDFGYNPEIARNVNVDVRYLLWILERIDRADNLLRELGAGK